MKKAKFRGHEIRPIFIQKYINKSEEDIEDVVKLKNEMTDTEFEIAHTIVIEKELKVIAAGLNLTSLNSSNSEIQENIYDEFERVCNSLEGNYEILLPLFFEDDMDTFSSNYFKSEQLRTLVYSNYKKRLIKQNIEMDKLKALWLEHYFSPLYSFGLADKFSKFSDKIGLQKILDREAQIEEEFRIRRYRIQTLMISIAIGLFFGPLGYIHVNYKLDSEEYPDDAWVYGNIGVTIPCIIYLILIFNFSFQY